MRLCKTAKIKISWLWLPCIVCMPYLHLSKLMFFIFLILSIHECAHMLVAYLFHYQIEEVRIYPFGFSATIPELGYGSLIKEICIIAAGPLSQVLFPMLFECMCSWGVMSSTFTAYLKMINANILIFNLLPIYPLDGGRLLQSFFHSLFRYRRAQQFTCIASFLVLIVLFAMQCLSGASALFMQVFLCIQIVLCYRDITHMQLRFYHYRYLHPISYPIIINKRHDLFRGRFNIMRQDDRWVDERAWLFRRYGKHEKS